MTKSTQSNNGHLSELLEQVDTYVNDHLLIEPNCYKFGTIVPIETPPPKTSKRSDHHDFPDDENNAFYDFMFFPETDESFVEKMLNLIREKNMIETEVYKAAQIDRRLFSKIISNKDYKPSKDTCISLCFGLKLNLDEAEDLLFRAGYTLSHSIKRDLIIEYFFYSKQFDILQINEVLFQFHEKPLGRE